MRSLCTKNPQYIRRSKSVHGMQQQIENQEGDGHEVVPDERNNFRKPRAGHGRKRGTVYLVF